MEGVHWKNFAMGWNRELRCPGVQIALLLLIPQAFPLRSWASLISMFLDRSASLFLHRFFLSFMFPVHSSCSLIRPHISSSQVTDLISPSVPGLHFLGIELDQCGQHQVTPVWSDQPGRGWEWWPYISLLKPMYVRERRGVTTIKYARKTGAKRDCPWEATLCVPPRCGTSGFRGSSVWAGRNSSEEGRGLCSGAGTLSKLAKCQFN